MKQKIKQLGKSLLRATGHEIRSTREVWKSRRSYSHFDEDKIIASLFEKVGETNRFYLDIAAGEGVDMSNTLALLKRGWSGLCVEADPKLFGQLATRYAIFPKVELARCFVTPDNVAALCEYHDVPAEPDFLSLDIDGYDNAVLGALLQARSPRVFVTEVNQVIPPPIRFAVNYSPDFAGYRGDGFFGHSLAQAAEVAGDDYSLIHLEYNNAFFVRADLARQHEIVAVTPEVAYAQAKRLYRGSYGDRVLVAPAWEAPQSMAPEAAVEWFRQKFRRYEGQFLCEI